MRPNAKALRAREHNAKMWQKGQQGEKGANQEQLQDHQCCDNAAQDHCCDNAAHQKSHQPIARDGKVGVSRLPEEDHHRCAEGDLVFEKV